MHHGPSPSLAATLRALRGETDLRVIAPALGNWRFARILALAPGVDPVVGAPGALASEVPDFLAPAECNASDLSAAIVSLIGTEAGNDILEAWVDVAPVGWGASHAAALIDAAQRDRCPRWAAAALIGSTNDAVALLHDSWDIALAIRRWGQATPDLPTAWMNHVPPAKLNRFLEELCSANVIAARCLPWLSAEHAARLSGYVCYGAAEYALDGYAVAPSVARAGHAGIISSLMRHATRVDLAELTRLAVASRMDAAWTTVVQILHEHPDAARHVVAAAPWDDVPGEVQDAIPPPTTATSAPLLRLRAACVTNRRRSHGRPPAPSSPRLHQRSGLRCRRGRSMHGVRRWFPPTSPFSPCGHWVPILRSWPTPN